MKFMQTEKKQLLIYVIIAYGITYVMGLLMWYGYGKGLDLSAFPNAQMLYPAAGVMMAYLITKTVKNMIQVVGFAIILPNSESWPLRAQAITNLRRYNPINNRIIRIDIFQCSLFSP